MVVTQERKAQRLPPKHKSAGYMYGGAKLGNHAETGCIPTTRRPLLLRAPLTRKARIALCGEARHAPQPSARETLRRVPAPALDGAQSVFAFGLGSRAFHSRVPATAAAHGATQYTKNHCASIVTDLSYTAFAPTTTTNTTRAEKKEARGAKKKQKKTRASKKC